MAVKHFADFGAEKMLYDARMQPQAILYKDTIYIAYFANPQARVGHPYIITYNIEEKQWSEPVKLGDNPKADHHLAPIIWIENTGIIHVLYGCHFSPGVHLVSTKPGDITSWDQGAEIAPSISYPSVRRIYKNQLLLLYRVEGHLGHWVYSVSFDQGNTWDAPQTFMDFDHDPQDETDKWAGSYLSACTGQEGKALYIGFCHWEERDNINPDYKFNTDLFSRYDLYYVWLDIPAGKFLTVTGEEMDLPINRRTAEKCKIISTGNELSNFPSVIEDQDMNPCLLVPVTEGNAWRTRFHFFNWYRGMWQHTTLAKSDNTWSGSQLFQDADGTFRAYLIAGQGKKEEYHKPACHKTCYHPYNIIGLYKPQG